MVNNVFLENYKISIFTHKEYVYLYIYNKYYYCLVKLSKRIKINIKTNKIIEFKNLNKQSIVRDLNIFLKQFYFYEFTKIKFTGKGYKIKKNTNKSIVLLFNRAHTTTLWWKNMFVKKLKKYKMYIKYNAVQKKVISTIIGVRPINIFTKKGLRKSRQILFKKKGKK